jgi:hypothetical protein
LNGYEEMAVQTYLIHLRDRQLALAVGAELEDRLARDGRDAVALVPAGDGFALTRADSAGRGASRASYGRAPQVVALYEEGLLAKLESLGLTAYVGVCPDEDPAVVRWGTGGAMLLPVSTARDLVQAVADHTPWAQHAARIAKFASPQRPDTGQPGPTTRALPRKLAVAGIAGPLLLAGVPAAAASASAAPAAHHPSARAGVSAFLAAKTTTQAMTTPAIVPASTQAFLNQIGSLLRSYLQQTGQSTANNVQVGQALESEIMRLVNAFINGQARTSPQPATSPQSANPAATNAGANGQGSSGPRSSPGSQGSGGQRSPSSQNPSQQDQQAQDQQAQDQQAQDQQAQDQQAQDQQAQDQRAQDQQAQDQQAQDQQGQDQQGQDQQGQDSQGSFTSQGPVSGQGSGSAGGTSSSGSASTSQGSGSASGSGGSFSGGGASSGGSA